MEWEQWTITNCKSWWSRSHRDGKSILKDDGAIRKVSPLLMYCLCKAVYYAKKLKMKTKNFYANLCLTLGIVGFIDCYVWWVLCYSFWKWKYIDMLMLSLTCSIFLIYLLCLIFGIIGLINNKKYGDQKKGKIKIIVGFLSLPMFFFTQIILYVSGYRNPLIRFINQLFEWM